jgi:hypothetical protein
MQTETFFYKENRGWSVPVLPALDSPSTMLLTFGCSLPGACTKAIDELVAAYPSAQIIGCSTAGEICERSIDEGSLAVAVCRFDRTRLRSVSVPIRAVSASREAGRAIAAEIMAPDLRGVLVISDGMMVNGSELVNGLNSVLPPQTVVTGGLAGDADRFQKTWVLAHRRMESGWVSALGFYGSKGGWDAFGPERVVTRSDGNVLYEIDGKSALALYKAYLGDLAVGLPANALLFPLSLRRLGDDDTKLVRTILSIDEKAESMTFAGDIPQGSRVRFMRANFDRLVDGASEATRLATAPGASGVLAVAISCVGRRLVLGNRAEEEVEAVHDNLPANSHLVGFYSYGEISPYAIGRCELHNQTMTLTTLAEG